MDTTDATISPKPVMNRQNVSFKFTKTTNLKSLPGNKLEETSKPKDYVKSVDDTKIKSTLPETKSQELVIPLIRKNNWRIPEAPQTKDGEATLNQLAVQELLKETANKNAEWDNRDSSTMAIPLIMQNKVPEGFETDDKLDVSLRAQESTLEDYEKVPVEQFGLAMLRGMGWKEGMGIGARHKECVQPIEVKLRPKGLGLGADASVLKKSEKKAKEEKLELKKDAFVQIIQGPHKGHYGQVLGLDEETGRAVIKLSNDGTTKSLPEFFFNLVSKKEYDKESRIINRESYEKYKIKEENKHKEEREKHNSFDSKSNGRDDQDSYERESRKSKKHSKKRRHSRERSEEYESSGKAKQAKIWIRPLLRVRFIDEKYKKGRYFNQKLIVVDVLSSSCCSLKTEDDRTLLDDISPSMLETVIPRDESAYVMIVQGKYQGELCTILKRDKANSMATVQFLSDRDRAIKIDYDSICEYVGDVAQYD